MMRTGGTSCVDSLKCENIGYHKPRSLLPEKFKHMRVVGNVRNPFDWYVSLYNHPNFVLLNIFDFKEYDFVESITKLLDLSWMTEYDKERAIFNFPESVNWDIVQHNFSKDNLKSYLDGDIGFLTWVFKHMYEVDGSVDGVVFCKTENLDLDWENFTGHKHKPFPTLRRSVDYSTDNTQHYTDELIDLIKHKDEEYILKFYPDIIFKNK